MGQDAAVQRARAPGKLESCATGTLEPYPTGWRGLVYQLNQRYRAEFDRAERLQDELDDIRASRAWRLLGWLRGLKRQWVAPSPRPCHDMEEMQPFPIVPVSKPTRSVSIIIPFRDQATLLRRCLTSLRKSTYADYDVVLVDNGSTEDGMARVLRRIRRRQRYCIVHDPEPFNFSRLCNGGAFVARGDYLLFLNNDVEVITPDWLERMLVVAQQPGIGAVGATLLYPDETLQHAGIVSRHADAGFHSERASDHCHVYRGKPAHYAGRHGELRHVRRAPAVTGACLLVRKDLFNQLGGFDERHAITFNDVDLCQRVRQRGLHVAITPHARLYHYESLSRGYCKEQP